MVLPLGGHFSFPFRIINPSSVCLEYSGQRSLIFLKGSIRCSFQKHVFEFFVFSERGRLCLLDILKIGWSSFRSAVAPTAIILSVSTFDNFANFSFLWVHGWYLYSGCGGCIYQTIVVGGHIVLFPLSALSCLYRLRTSFQDLPCSRPIWLLCIKRFCIGVNVAAFNPDRTHRTFFLPRLRLPPPLALLGS